jgi:hypothetical protein
MIEMKKRAWAANKPEDSAKADSLALLKFCFGLI